MHRVTPTGLLGTPAKIQTKPITLRSEPELTYMDNPQIKSMHTLFKLQND